MEITQMHIPDIPAFKTLLNTDVSTSVGQSITSFFEEYWGWIVGMIVVGIFLKIVLTKPKKDKEPISQTN